MTAKKSRAARAAKLLDPLADAPVDFNDWDDLGGWPPEEVKEPPRGKVVHLFKPVPMVKPIPMVEHALAYAREGWPVLPCKGANGERTPAGKADKAPLSPNGVLDATTDPDRIRKFWKRWPDANIGLAAGDAGLLVLDYDVEDRNDKPAVEAIRAAVAHAVPDLPGTKLIAKTPRGGEHHYYELDPGELVACGANTFTEHVDTRSFHGYVLLPPSRTVDGTYEWINRGRPTRRSDDLLEACRRAREKHKDRDNWTIEPDLPENVALATTWLAKTARPAIEGQGGDLLTYSTAAMCKSYGLSEGTALKVMLEHWNDRCSPPWECDELEGKVANAYTYNTSPPGNMTPAYRLAKKASDFAAVEEELGEGRQVKVGRFRAVDREALQVITPPEWLVPDAIPEDAYAMLVGPSGSYKTFVALDMALTVDTGGGALVAGEWQGLWDAPRRPGPVLFAAGEGRSNLRKRVEAWERIHWGGERVRDFVLIDPVPHITGGDIDAFIDAARRHHEKYSLVVLDTVARAMQGVNTSADEHATAFTRIVDKLRYELGCSVLALHHTGYGPQDRARGSSAFLGDPDTILISEWIEKGLTRLTMTKQKDAEAWEQPRWAKMERVALGEGQDSLVATRGEAPVGSTGKKMRGEATLAVVDRHALAALRRYPDQEFTDTKLAQLMATKGVETAGGDVEELGLKEQTLRNKWLPDLRQRGSGARVQQMYDAFKTRWRYSATAAGDFGSVS